jgi:DNA modification methylase
MPDQSSFNLSTAKTGPVECLGQTFPSEEARREHFIKLLAAKLKESAFRQIEGFPLGTDEAILALSDPPYYTACPNPWLGDFIKHYGTTYDSKKPYHREPFAADVSEGKNHPIYNAHSYHTKVPHRAIMKYILHYTQPGDVVFDGFCGTGMTGVAAHLCSNTTEVQSLGYRVRDDGVILNEESTPISKLGVRYAALDDLAPAATFIAQNYNLPIDEDLLQSEGEKVIKRLKKECGWMYMTRDPKSGDECEVTYIIWSDVFGCPECGGEIIFWKEAVDTATEKVRDSIICPHCKTAGLEKGHLHRAMEAKYDQIRKTTHSSAKRVPVLIEYIKSAKRLTKRPDDYDIDLIKKTEDQPPAGYYPDVRIDRDIDLWYERDYRSLGVDNVYDFFTRRALHALSSLRSAILELPDARMRTAFAWILTSVVEGSSLMNRERPGGMPSKLSGTLYIGALIREINVISFVQRKIKKLKAVAPAASFTAAISTQSSTKLNELPANCIDYIFIDPPFGSNIIYSDLSILWEGWLGISTSTPFEAVVHRRKKENAHGLADYQGLMLTSFKEAFRVLKPGRWMTVEFSNTQASVWNSLQTTLQQAGFVVANVSALDKQQGSFKAVTTTTAVKQDLVISAYKPNGGLEDRFSKIGNTVAGIWDFIRTHLKNLPIIKPKGGQLEPIAERDPRILYDRMVAFYIGHSIPVPLSSAEFQAELQEQFPNRDGMVFLPEQVNIYDQKRVQMDSVGQLSIFVEDERSAIDWVRQFIKERPSTQQDIHPDFTQQLTASWKKWEARPELRLLLDQNFLCYDGVGEVPSQIHSYLSTQFKELRNLDKDHAQLRHKAKDRWYVPDPKKNIDVETLRNKRLLEEFWLYLPEGYISAARNPDKAPTLPGMAAATPRPKVPRSKKLREVRTEAIRVGFKYCYQSKDYYTILAVADMLPESVLNEDEQLQMLYDNAALRSGATAS